MKFISEILLLMIFGISFTFAVNTFAEDPFPNGKVALTSEDPNADMHKGSKPNSGFIPPSGGIAMIHQDQQSCCGPPGTNRSTYTMEFPGYIRENFQPGHSTSGGTGGSSSSGSGKGVKKNK